ncbi:MAG: hypothetical protein H6Q72_2850 [Firmicutes bacterium]|nr:hypothetical protein [Bacillota bacterium]
MLTIVWDIDDVLNNLMHEWFHKKWLLEHPNCHCGYKDLTINPPHEILKVTKEEYLCSLDEFRMSEMMNLQPNQEVLSWFEEHGKKYRHLALTAVPGSTADLSAFWLIRHFGKWIRSFNFVPSERASDCSSLYYDRTKYDFLKWLEKADILIDDNSINIKSAQESGITTYLVSRPWNSGGVALTEVLRELTTVK